jgi:hypothetical protein
MARAETIEVEQAQKISRRPGRNWLSALGLFFLAPLVAEFLLGNLPIKLLPALVVLAPMYGGGALLIRELVRRSGRGWPSIFLLGLAYGIFEEGFATQSLFNPDYLGLKMHLLQPAYIPALRMGAWWTIFVLSLHMIWSVSASIALAEAAVPDRAERPWLGRPGLVATTLLFAIGVAATTIMSYKHDHFIALPGQFVGAAVAIFTLVIAAFRLPRTPAREIKPATGIRAVQSLFPEWTPNPWLAGIIALALCSAIQNTPSGWGWWAAAILLVLELSFGAAILIWSRQSGWDMRHKLALAAGATLAYGWHSFIEHPVTGGSVLAVRIGNVIFVGGAIGLIAFAARRLQSFRTAETSQSR